MTPPSPPFVDFLRRSAQGGATADQIAEAVHTAWRQIDTAMAPVIGQRGVAALYMRSLHLSSASQPTLKELQAGGALDQMNLDALKAALARQGPQQAADAGGTLLMSFHQLVGSLIGAALSGQLLGDVWMQFFGGPTAQDPSP